MTRRIGEGSTAKSRARRQGAASFELALILPLLMMIVLIAVDFGRFAYRYIALTNAVRAAGAYAIMNSYLAAEEAVWKSSVEQAGKDEMEKQTGHDAKDLTIEVQSITEKQTGLRRVEVKGQYPFTTIVTWPGIPSNVTLKQAVQLRVIR